MKAVILAGGLGTRFAEETDFRPKPMIEIGGMPILWHIMKIYASHGINDFVICLGYKGYMIKEFFHNYYLHTSDVTISTKTNSMKVHQTRSEDWNISLINTGELAMTGARIKKIKDYVGDDFCLTYGDGVSDVNIAQSIEFHKKHGKIATLTSVAPPSRFGILDIKNNVVESFKEKPKNTEDLINGGFFVLKNKVFDYIGDGDDVVFERKPLEALAESGNLMSYRHNGFWQAMDMLRDKKYLEELWIADKAAWKTWK